MSPNTLSQREWEVARLASIGVSNKGIASVLNVAEGTVKVHLHRIMQKLGVKNRTVLAAIILGPAARPATHEEAERRRPELSVRTTL
jgi:two-component system, NarL family, nitrate/nitrite response regulator NarL